MTIEIPTELDAEFAEFITLAAKLFRKAYVRGVTDGATHIDAAFERHREMMDAIERRLAVRLEPPTPPPPRQDEPRQARTAPAVPWTAEEDAHCEEYRLGRITYDELVKRLPNRTPTQIRPKIERWKAKMARHEMALRRQVTEIVSGSTQNSAPPSSSGDDHRPAEAEIVDDTGSARAPLPVLAVTEPGIDGAETDAGRVLETAPTRPPQVLHLALGNDEGSPAQPPADSESGETGRRDEFKPRFAAGSNPASRTIPPGLAAQPSPQSQIDNELSRAVRKSEGGAPISALDSKPPAAPRLSTGVKEPPLDLPDSEKLMGSR